MTLLVSPFKQAESTLDHSGTSRESIEKQTAKHTAFAYLEESAVGALIEIVLLFVKQCSHAIAGVRPSFATLAQRLHDAFDARATFFDEIGLDLRN